MNIWWSLGLVIVSLFAGYTIERWHNSGQIAQLTDQVKVCGQALTTANASVAQAKADGDKRVADGQTALQAVNKQNKGLLGELGKLRTASKVSSATLTCQDADKEILKALVK